MTADRHEVAVIGGGPAGLTAAIALAAHGVDTVLVAKPPGDPDHRTTALLASSVTALAALGVWEACRPHAASLSTMRIIDDTQRLIRAPEARFSAAEIGLEAFGYNIENRHLVAALSAHADALPRLRRIPAAAEAVEPGTDAVTVRLSAGRAITARLAIGADGRRSLCRQAAGIETEFTPYPQTALTLNLAHTRPHRDTSTEFHTETGPFTLVPLPGRRSGLVWVADPAQAERLARLDEARLAAAVEQRSHSILGKVTVEPGRGMFPLTALVAHRFAANRIALVGEAAHVLPPIGAQGLNLGLRDAAAIAELAVAVIRAGTDPGAAEVTGRYDAMRRGDVAGRALAIDMLNRSLLSDFLPVQGARGLGLFLLDRIGPLRRAVMREGVAPSSALPRLMRGESL